MALTTALKPISFGEYLLRPYDRKRTELVNGEIVEMSEASPLHVLIIKLLRHLLDEHLKVIGSTLDTFDGCGVEIPRETGKNNVRDPDLLLCEVEQFESMLGLTKAIFLEGNTPALVVEVASPGNTSRDTVDKRLEYAWAKVPEYWIINPVDKKVLTMALNGDTYRELGEFEGDDLILSELLPKFCPKASLLLSGRLSTKSFKDGTS